MLAEPGSIAARYSNGRDFNMAESLVIELAKDSIAKIVRSSFDALTQDEALTRNVRSSDKELEIEHTKVTMILPKCSEFDNQIIELLSEAYHLVYGGPKNLLYDSTDLTEIRTPMNNTVLHIAALHGNDEIVTLIIEHAPKLLFTLNDNNDSVLHVAARGGHISTIRKLLATYANFERHDIKMAWLEYTKDLDDLEEYDGMSKMLEFVKKENAQGNTMLHEAMLCDNKYISRNVILEVCELFKTKDKCCYEYALDIVNHAQKSVVYLAVENGMGTSMQLK
ncbi:hypothetical protein TSUD_249560 [Trifolium subterraneum]|nr:hypothetical protein TSUD_249560 [Trifolium subterraneum]